MKFDANCFYLILQCSFSLNILQYIHELINIAPKEYNSRKIRLRIRTIGSFKHTFVCIMLTRSCFNWFTIPITSSFIVANC